MPFAVASTGNTYWDWISLIPALMQACSLNASQRLVEGSAEHLLFDALLDMCKLSFPPFERVSEAELYSNEIRKGIIKWAKSKK